MTATRMLGITVLIIVLLIAACSGKRLFNALTPDLPNGTSSENLAGYLYDSDGNPLPNMIVNVTDLEGNPLGECLTNEHGYFFFDINLNGNYKIFARSSASDGPAGEWLYGFAQDPTTFLDPGTPTDGGIVNPEGQLRMSIPEGGELREMSDPVEYDVDITTGYPLSFGVKAANSMFKIRPNTDLNALSGHILIQGARGEHEAFQIVPVLFDGVNQVDSITVEASDLVKGSDRIHKENITLYKEHYVLVSEASDSGGATGYWPDALAPLSDPFDVRSDFPSPVWIDIYIPRDQAAGIYSGQISVKHPTEGTYSLSYNVKVWDITLEEKFYMKANFGLDQEDIASTHNLDYGLASLEGRAMARNYASFLADRHIAVHGIRLFQPLITINPDNRSVSLDFSTTDSDIDLFLKDYELPVFTFPLDLFDCLTGGAIGNGEALFTSDFNARFIDYVTKVSTHLSATGYFDRTYIQLVDEPSSYYDYQLVRSASNLIKQANPHPRHMVTEQPAPEDPSWGTLTDSVDIFTSGLRCFYNMGGEDIARQGGQNKEEWLYTNANLYPFPSFAIDKQGIETRLFVWFAYQHGFRGIFYFSTNNWTNVNPWENPLTFGSGFGNGCGSLLYPGTMVRQFTGQDNVDGPVTSIRLELIRDGLEDAQLLWMLGQGNPVSAANQLMTTWYSYSNNPVELMNVREEIATSLGG